MVSVIIPFFNCGRYLRDCLESVVNQCYSDLDIVLVNDGSGDDSIRIAREFADRDKRIFIINKLNGGTGSARNVGIEFVKNSILRSYVLSKCDPSSCPTVHDLYYEQIRCLDSIITVSAPNEIVIDVASLYDWVNGKFGGPASSCFYDFLSVNNESWRRFFKSNLPTCQHIIFLDGDDFLDSDCISSLMSVKSDVVLFDLYNCVDLPELSPYCGLPRDRDDPPFLQYSFIDSRPYTGYQVLSKSRCHFMSSQCKLFRTDVIRCLRFLENCEYEDNAFGILLLALSSHVFPVRRRMYCYRIREGSIMNYSKNALAFPQGFSSFSEYSRFRAAYSIARNAYCIFQFRQSISSSTDGADESRNILDFFIRSFFINSYFVLTFSQCPKSLDEQVRIMGKYYPLGRKQKLAFRNAFLFRLMFRLKQLLKEQLLKIL